MLCLTMLQSIACGADPPYRGRSSDEWIAQLRAPSPSARVDATTALGEILRIHPGSGTVTAALVHALADSSDDVRLAAGDALAQPEVDASGAVEGLIHVAYDSAHADVRASALRLLARISGSMDSSKMQPQLDGLVRVWTDALGDSSALVRAASADALDRVGARLRPRSAALLNVLSNLAHDPEPRMRIRALTILGNVSMPDSLARAALLHARADPDSGVRAEATHALARFRQRGGLEAPPREPSLTERCRDLPPRTRGC